MAGEEGAAGGDAVEESLAHVVELPLGYGHSFEDAEVVLVAHLRLAGIAVEGCSHVEGVGHGHDFMDHHCIPILACEKLMVAPIHSDVGMPQAQVVNGGISRTGEVALDVCAGLGAQHVGAVDAEAETGGDGQHIGLPAVVDVVTEAVAQDGLGVEEHHVLASAYHRATVGIVVRVDEAVPAEAEGRLGF